MLFCLYNQQQSLITSVLSRLWAVTYSQPPPINDFMKRPREIIDEAFVNVIYIYKEISQN